jgi:hypothetical protein
MVPEDELAGLGAGSTEPDGDVAATVSSPSMEAGIGPLPLKWSALAYGSAIGATGRAL